MDKLDGTPHYHKDEDLELRTRLDKIWGHSTTMWTKVYPSWTHLPSSSGELGKIYIPFVHVTKDGLSTEHLPTSFCPRIYRMTPNFWGTFLCLTLGG